MTSLENTAFYRIRARELAADGHYRLAAADLRRAIELYPARFASGELGQRDINMMARKAESYEAHAG